MRHEMSDANVLERTSHQDDVYNLISRVTCRRAIREDERAAIFKLRYACYKREGALPEGAPQLFTDSYDTTPNSAIFGYYIDGALVASIRVHVGAIPLQQIPAMTAFADIMGPLLARGIKVTDPTRFVIDADASHEFPRLSSVVLRACTMVQMRVQGIFLATVRTEHQAFYRRLMNAKLVCPARKYPSLAKPISLMFTDHQSMVGPCMRRFPYFASTPEERQAVLGDFAKQFEDDATPPISLHDLQLAELSAA